MIRVGVVGASGRMGQEVCRAVLAASDLELAAAIDPQQSGVSLGPLLGRSDCALVISGDLKTLVEADVQVAVDFTVADAARVNLGHYAEWSIHAVVGTTGLSASDLEQVNQSFASSRANAVVAANFAIGAVLLMRFCELAAPFMDGVEVIELHHDQKRDAPSGTALTTADRIAEARRLADGERFPADPTTLTVLEGARGGEGPGGVRVHSVRLPGLVAHEEVIFGAVGQSLTVRHDSYDRTSFMPGVLLAVRQVADHPGLTVGLDELLGF
jgi:4-hydroxy-tetrahydrodipicolinate reductase